MKSHKLKTLFIAFTMAILMCVFTTLLSISFADETEERELSNVVAASGLEISKSNIDLIIENSHKDDFKDDSGKDLSKFYVVELGSRDYSFTDSDYSPLYKMLIGDLDSTSVYSGQVTENTDKIYSTFEQCVIDMNSSKYENLDVKDTIANLLANNTFSDTDIMKADKLVYNYIYIPASMDDAAIEAAKKLIIQADLIYLSDYPDKNTCFKSDHDIPEDIKIQLSSTVLGKYVPFIIDNPTFTQQIINNNLGSALSFNTVATKVYYPNGTKKFASYYDTAASTDPVKYVNRLDVNSLFLPINSDKTGWFMYPATFNIKVNDKTADTPVEGVTVSVTNPAGTATDYTTDADGMVYVTDVAAGDYKVTIAASGIPAGATVTELTDETVTVEVGKKNVYTVATDSNAGGLSATEPDTIDLNASRILVIQKGSTDNTVSTNFSTGLGLTAVEDKYATDKYVVYNVPDDCAMQKYGYLGTNRPQYIKFEYADINDTDVLNGLATKDYIPYDYVIFEKGIGSTVITGDTYNVLGALMYGLKHIVYDKSLVTSNTNTDDTTISKAENYFYIYDKVADSKGNSRMTNVLATHYNNMRVYAGATNGKAVKDIADIINKGSYRGNGGGNGNTNVYNVLELQPSYPTDLNLVGLFNSNLKTNSAGNSKRTQLSDYEVANGYYYLRTDGVLSKTIDEISYDEGKTSVSGIKKSDGSLYAYGTSLIVSDNYDNVYDFYDWELSNAKIAHATGLKMEQVNVDHMSTYEFNSKRETLLDNYDLIYIGGNNSAIKTSNVLDQYDAGNIYDMYYITGAGLMTGNDFTDDKYEELKNYIESGMPVVVSEQLCTELQKNANGGTEKHIDPNSNIQKLYATMLSNAYGGTGGTKSVLLNFDPHSTVKVPNDGSYGTTYNGYVTVFDGLATEVFETQEDASTGALSYTLNSAYTPAVGINEAALVQLINSCSMRPKYLLKERPIKYEGFGSTAVKTRTLKWTYEVTDKSEGCIPKLYIDESTDSLFTDDEEATNPANGFNCSVSGNTVTLELDDDFYGAIYWKFILYSADEKVAAAVTDISKVAMPEDVEKMQVNLLQIVTSGPGAGKSGQNSKNTIYFCTECQCWKNVLLGNRWTQDGKYSQQTVQNANYGDVSDQVGGVSRTKRNSGIPALAKKIQDNDSSYIYVGNNIGVHIHNFGLPKYDNHYQLAGSTSEGWDDWAYNLADDLLDEYDFNTYIVTTGEYEAMIADINSKYSGVSAEEFPIYRKVYRYLAELYSEYYTTYKNYYISGKSQYFCANDGNYYDTSGNLVDSDIDDVVLLKKLNDKLVLGSSAFDSYMEYYNSPDASSDDLYYISIIDGAHPTNEVSQTRLEQIFNECESNTGGIDVNVQSLNRYAVAQGNLKNLISAFGVYAKNNPSDFSGLNTSGKATYAQMLQECDYETGYDRYSDILSFKTNYMQNDFPKSAFTYTKNGFETNGKFKSSTATVAAKQFYTEIGYNDSVVADGMYEDWLNAKIIEDYLSKSYIKYLRYSGMDDNKNIDLSVAYSQIVVGATEDYDQEPDALKSSAAIKALRTYVNADAKSYSESGMEPEDGHLLLFHNTLTAGDSAMVKGLRYTFGMDITGTALPVDDSGTDDPSSSEPTTPVSTYTAGTTKYAYLLKTSPSNGTLNYNGSQISNAFNIYSNLPTPTFTFSGDVTNVSIDLYSQCGVSMSGYSQLGNDSNTKYKVTTSGSNTSMHNITYSFTAHNYNWGNGMQEDNGTYYLVVSDTNGPFKITANNVIALNNNVNENLSNGTDPDSVIDLSSIGSGGGGTTNPAAEALRNGYHGMTQTFVAGNDVSKTKYMQRYVNFLYSDTQVQQYASTFDAAEFVSSGSQAFSDKSSQVNNGIVTMYPFLIGKNIKVSATHPQDYAANIKDENMVVWYTLDGGTVGTQSSPATADPHDGADNYFLYSYGSVAYCGAGHSDLTGHNRDNNDERLLLINLIVNSAHRSVKGPGIKVHDYVTQDEANLPGYTPTNGSGIGKVSPDGSGYKIKVNDEYSVPQFVYIPTMDAKSEVSEVKIYYDLTPTNPATGVDEFGFVSARDHLIYNQKADSSAEGLSIAKNKYKSIDNAIATNRLRLDPSYFVHEGNNTAYIIIAVKTNKGKITTKKIKVVLSPKLYDLT